MCNTGSKVYFWDLARLEAYFDYIAALPASSTSAANATLSVPSSSSNLGPNSSQNQEQNQRPSFLIPFRHRNRGAGMLGSFSKDTLSRVRDSSPTDSASSHQTGSDGASAPAQSEKDREREKGKEDMEKSKEIWARKYDMGDPLTNIAPHKEEVVRGLHFLGRQVAWSGDGEWCVVVGSSGVIAVFQRWGK
jgi:polycomb protein EED